ncbi:MAG: hypothetical protein EXR21_07785 [Flavobacteriaceae bacterium]|nr:hypothetical protein [Flavobacteriaceae bacterium]
MESTERRSGSGKVIVIIALLLLVTADVFLLYQLFNKNDEIDKKEVSIKKLNEAKDSLVIEINTLTAQLADLKKENEGFGEKSAEFAKIIADLTARLSNAKRAAYSGDPKLIAQAKKDMAEARKMKANFESEMATTRAELELARKKNVELNDSLGLTKTDAEKLKKDKGQLAKKIKESSALKADNILATPLKTGKKGDKPTTKAKSASKVKICFKLQQNLVTDEGLKTIYLRVLGPDRSVISNNTNNTFNFDGDNLPYSEKKEVQYDNKDTDVCMNFKKSTAFAKGNYTMEIYEGGVIVGKSTFLLK